MINKEVLTLFIYKSTLPTEKLFISKNFEKLLLYVYLTTRVGKCSNAFDQLLIY